MFDELSVIFRDKIEEWNRKKREKEKEKTRIAKLQFKLERKIQKQLEKEKREKIKKGWNPFRKDFGDQLSELNTHRSCVSCIRISKGSRLISTCSYDKGIHIYIPVRNKRGHRERWVQYCALNGHDAEVIAVDFSPKGDFLASASWDMTVKIWKMPDDDTLEKAQHKTLGIRKLNESAIAGDRGPELLWHTFEDHTRRVLSVRFSTRGNILASGDWGGNVHIWSMITKRVLHTISAAHKGMVLSLDFSPHGDDYLVSGASDQKVRLWKMKKNKLSKAFDPKLFKALDGHLGTVCSVAFSPDTRITNDKAEVRVDGKRTFRRFEVRKGLLLTAAGDMMVRLFSLQTCECLYTLEEHSGWVLSAAWAPDGRSFASVDDDHNFIIWDVETRTTLSSKSNGHAKIIQSVAYSDDSTLIATASWDGTAKIWMASERTRYLEAWNDRFETREVALDDQEATAVELSKPRKGEEIVGDGSDRTEMWPNSLPRSHRRVLGFELPGKLQSNSPAARSAPNRNAMERAVPSSEAASTGRDPSRTEKLPHIGRTRAPRRTAVLSVTSSLKNRKHTKLFRMRPTLIRKNFQTIQSGAY